MAVKLIEVYQQVLPHLAQTLLLLREVEGVGIVCFQFLRLTSFIGTSNRRMLLHDRTGSRRYICVELAGPIDVATPVDHAQLYAQALHLLEDDFRCWLDEEETLRLEEHNAPYKTEHGPEELLVQHFAPVEKKKHYEEDELWSAVAVYDYLHRIDPLLMRSVERTTFGMYIRRMGFEQVRRENKRYFALRAVS